MNKKTYNIMNNTVCKFVLFTVISFSLYQTNAQSPITVYTPRGSSVYAHTRPELMDDEDKSDCSEWVETYYPQATELNPPSATTTYNCHSYAWHMSEGGTTCTIAYYYGDTDESIYWTDNSYTETTETYASKISYTSDDHSAIQTSTQGIYISKWGDYPLMQHARDYGPYNMSSRDYYKLNPGVNGSSDELCYNQERTYTSNTSITGSTYSWTRNTSLLDYVSGAGTTDYRVKAKSNDGEGWVRLEITTPSGEVATTSNKYVWVNKPYVNPASIQFECADGTGYLCTNFFGNEFSFTFDYPYNYFNIKLTNLGETQTYDQFTIYDTWGTIDCFPPEGTYLFHVRGNNDCGTATNWSKKEVEYVDCGMRGLFSLDIYPNPSTEQATITIVSNENMNAVTNNVDDAWRLEVYTQGQLLKLNIPAIIDNKYVLNTSGWKPGMYYIRVYYKDEVLWGTLIVNK